MPIPEKKRVQNYIGNSNDALDTNALKAKVQGFLIPRPKDPVDANIVINLRVAMKAQIKIAGKALKQIEKNEKALKKNPNAQIQPVNTYFLRPFLHIQSGSKPDDVINRAYGVLAHAYIKLQEAQDLRSEIRKRGDKKDLKILDGQIAVYEAQIQACRGALYDYQQAQNKNQNASIAPLANAVNAFIDQAASFERQAIEARVDPAVGHTIVHEHQFAIDQGPTHRMQASTQEQPTYHQNAAVSQVQQTMHQHITDTKTIPAAGIYLQVAPQLAQHPNHAQYKNACQTTLTQQGTVGTAFTDAEHGGNISAVNYLATSVIATAQAGNKQGKPLNFNRSTDPQLLQRAFELCIIQGIPFKAPTPDNAMASKALRAAVAKLQDGYDMNIDKNTLVVTSTPKVNNAPPPQGVIPINKNANVNMQQANQTPQNRN